MGQVEEALGREALPTPLLAVVGRVVSLRARLLATQCKDAPLDLHPSRAV